MSLAHPKHDHEAELRRAVIELLVRAERVSEIDRCPRWPNDTCLEWADLTIDIEWCDVCLLGVAVTDVKYRLGLPITEAIPLRDVVV